MVYIYCSRCGNKIAEDTIYCSKCGNKVNESRDITTQLESEEVYCDNCGALLKGTEKICPNCNHKIRNYEISDETTRKKRNIRWNIIIILFIIFSIIFSIFYAKYREKLDTKINLEKEMETVKSTFVYQFNSRNIEIYNATNRQEHYKYYSINNRNVELVTLTENMLNIEFIENYEGRNIFYITSKIENGIVEVYLQKIDTNSYEFVNKSEVCEGKYVYLQGDGSVQYSDYLDNLKKLIDNKNK